MDGVSKRWKIFLLPIWGSESKSAEKTVDAGVGGWRGVAAAGRGRAAQRGKEAPLEAAHEARPAEPQPPGPGPGPIHQSMLATNIH